jgi:hypothetical protein
LDCGGGGGGAGLVGLLAPLLCFGTQLLAFAHCEKRLSFCWYVMLRQAPSAALRLIVLVLCRQATSVLSTTTAELLARCSTFRETCLVRRTTIRGKRSPLFAGWLQRDSSLLPRRPTWLSLIGFGLASVAGAWLWIVWTHLSHFSRRLAVGHLTEHLTLINVYQRLGALQGTSRGA